MDTTLTTGVSKIVGKVVGVNYPLGVLVYALHLPLVVLFIIILPCLIIIVFEIMHITKILQEKDEENAEDKYDKAVAKKLRSFRSGAKWKRNGYSYYGNVNDCYMNCESCEEKGDCPYTKEIEKQNGKNKHARFFRRSRKPSVFVCCIYCISCI